jgi:hypothetical protein
LIGSLVEFTISQLPIAGDNSDSIGRGGDLSREQVRDGQVRVAHLVLFGFRQPSG